MKVGDVVIVKVIAGEPMGLVVEFDEDCGWPRVMIYAGKMVTWPASSMEVINESR